MPKIMTRCTTCGAILAVDSASHKEVCPYCGWSFTVNPIQESIGAGVQPGRSGRQAQAAPAEDLSISGRIRSVHRLLDGRKNYPEAIRQLSALASEAPDRYEVWWGLARYYTSDFSTTVFTDSGYQKASLAIENACRTASAANRSKIQTVWKSYTAAYVKDRKSKQNRVRPLHQLLAV